MKNKLLTTMAIASLLFLLNSCQDEISSNYNDPMSAYPKNVSIGYKLISTTSDAIIRITYTNSTGGDTQNDSISLPYEISFSKQVEFGEIFSLTASSNNAASMTLEILVNSVTGESKTFESSSFNVGSIAYQFK